MNAAKYGPEKSPYLDTFHALVLYCNFGEIFKNTPPVDTTFVDRLIKQKNLADKEKYPQQSSILISW